jgi:hypothetical protein
MKNILLIFTIISIFGFTLKPACGDGKVYANKKQTENDTRFDAYLKIDEVPKYKGGVKKLDKLILSKLKLSEAAKKQFFNLNYQFTVTCDGTIEDVKQIGDPTADDWTNIAEIIKATEVDWTPAKKDGITVDCVYFSRILINGSQY